MSEQYRVLVVDDEFAVRSTLKLASRKRPWQLETVESAEDALEMISDKTFDVALVDKNLPGMSGVELIREIRKTNLHMGVIMITGFASIDSAIETLHLGIDCYVEKPFDNIYDVVNMVEEVAAARRSKLQDDDAAAASMHFSKAIDALRAGKNTNEQLKIVVASPSDSDREWITQQFGESTRIVSASSSDEALKLVRNETPELLLIDISKHTPDELEKLKEMKTCAPQAGFIVLTAPRPPLSVVTPLIDLGIRVMLEKPLDTESFRAKLEYLAREAGHGTAPIEWSKGTA